MQGALAGPGRLNTGYVLLGLLLAFTAVQRLLELRRSLENARVSAEKALKEPVYPFMVALHASLFIIVPVEVLLFGRPFVPLMAAAALALFVVAQLVRFWIIRTMGTSWNVRVVKPVAITSSGPYRYVRHPNYSVVVAELIAIPLFHSAWISALFLGVLNAVVLARRVPFEEALLMQDDDYRRIMARRPRFVPGLSRSP